MATVIKQLSHLCRETGTDAVIFNIDRVQILQPEDYFQFAIRETGGQKSQQFGIATFQTIKVAIISRCTEQSVRIDQAALCERLHIDQLGELTEKQCVVLLVNEREVDDLVKQPFESQTMGGIDRLTFLPPGPESSEKKRKDHPIIPPSLNIGRYIEIRITATNAPTKSIITGSRKLPRPRRRCSNS